MSSTTKQKIVFLTGAGMSAESGIRTFRDAGGMWEEYPVAQVATIEGYEADPGLVIEFYNKRRRELLQRAQPNEGHRLVAALQDKYDVCVVTQNVDDLHERAGSRQVIHLHGELMKATSSRRPNDPRQIQTLSPDHPDIHLGDKAADGSQLRPFIVWFGESVPMMEPAVEQVAQADIIVVIGTSMVVYPAAGLIHYSKPGSRLFLIDPADVQAPTSLPIHVIRKGASEGMKELVALLG